MFHCNRRAPLTFLLILLCASGCSRPHEIGELTTLAHGKTDKGDIHGFTEIYDHLFFPLRSSATRVCEIGIAGGGSLQVWSRYFSKATVFGIDIYSLSQLRSMLRSQGVKEDFLPDQPETPRIKTFVADQANREQLKSFIDKYGGDFDIVLDDGGHTMEMQQVSLGFFFKYVKPAGYYVIEDVHTSLTDRYEGYGAQKGQENTTLRMINQFIRNARIESQYLRPEEAEYLNSRIEYCNLFVKNNSAHSITCIFKKKEETR